MAGRQEDRLDPLGRLGAAGAHLGGERRLGHPQVEAGERVERLAQGRGVGGDERRQLVEDPGDLLGLRDLRLAPGVAELDRDERLDEQRLAAARRVVDDALDPRPRLGLDRDDVAAVAERDDRLLEGAPELGADERVQPSPEPVVGDPDGRAQATETGRGRVEQLPDRVEAAGERRPDGRQRVELAAEVAQERAAARRRGASRGGPWRRGSWRSRGTGPGPAGRHGPPARRPVRCRGRRRSRRPAAPGPGHVPGRSRRGRGRRRPGRSTARAPRPAGATAGTRSPPRAVRGWPGTRASVADRASIGRPRSGPAGDRRAARARRTATASSPTARRRRPHRSVRSRRRAARARRPARPRAAAATPDRTGRRRSSRCRARTPRRPGRVPRPAGRPAAARSAAAAVAARSGVRPRRRVVARRMRSTRIDSIPSSGSTARMRSAAAVPAGSVTTLRQSYIP